MGLQLLVGCIGAGTHGSIKHYEYNVSKYSLEKAVNYVIGQSNTIHQDSIKDYYNDDSTYVTIQIVYGDVDNKYTFRYGGDAEYWDTSKFASLSIAYAHNKKGEGGSKGNGGVKWYDYELKKELTVPFERELISKVDKELNMKHKEQ